VIVTCEGCRSRFQLDETRVPREGARVRCSRCGRVFPVAHPGAPREDAEKPEPLASAEPDPSFGDGDDEEADWQFNEDLPAVRDADAPGRAAAKAVDALLSPGRGASGPGGDLGAPVDWDFLRGARPATAAAPAEPAAPPEPAPAEALPEPEPSLEMETDPETAEEPEEPRVEAAASAPGRVAIGRIPLERVPASRVQETRRDERVPAAPVGPRRAPAPRRGTAVGWAVGAVLLALGLYGGAVPHGAAPPPRSAVQAVGPLRATDLETRWVENLRAGSLLVVAGHLENPTQRAVSPGRLEVKLRDREGRPVDGPDAAAPLGPPVPRRLLREGDPRALATARAAAPVPPLAPGERRRFEAVVAEVPPSATRFRIEARDGSSG